MYKYILLHHFGVHDKDDEDHEIDENGSRKETTYLLFETNYFCLHDYANEIINT